MIRQYNLLWFLAASWRRMRKLTSLRLSKVNLTVNEAHIYAFTHMSAISILYKTPREYHPVWARIPPASLVGSDSGDLNIAKDELMSLRYFCSIYLLIEKHIHV